MAIPESRIAANWYTACPLCTGTELSNLYEVKGFTITKCGSCSLVFVREQMTDEALTPYYEDYSHDYVYDDDSNESNLNFYYRRLKQIIEQRVAQGKMLDVGCNRGQFLDVMDSKWERHGTELTARWVQLGRERYGNNIFQGPLADYKLEGKPFDVVTLLDVLDHCPKPIDDLKRVNRLLRKDGLVVIKVHNISCWYAQLTKEQFYAIVPPYHLFYFNKETLKRSLSEAGFKLVDTKFIGHLLDLKTVPYRLARGAEKGLYFQAYKMLSKTSLGKVKIYKDLHDIITVIGVKERDV